MGARPVSPCPMEFRPRKAIGPREPHNEHEHGEDG